MFKNLFTSDVKKDNDLYPKAGSMIGEYEVIDIAGAPGGTAVVLICKDHYGKKVAVKRFFKDKVSAKMRERIYEESNLDLQSSYLVTSIRVFENDGYIHSVMPFIRGKSLSDIFCHGDGIAEVDVIHLGTRLAIAACDLQRHDIISTDIKPDNILINAIGHVKVIDLTCFEKIGKKPEISRGTIPYAAPELDQRQTLSAATDIYSIGMVLYEALVGGNTFKAQQFKPQLSDLSMHSQRISRIISKALEPNQHKRYQTARALLNDLNGLSQCSSTQQKFSIKGCSGKKIVIQPGKYALGRDELAPQSLYMSKKQFEFDYDGIMAQVRDIANKNLAYLNNTPISQDWTKIRDSSLLHIADVDLKLNLK